MPTPFDDIRAALQVVPGDEEKADNVPKPKQKLSGWQIAQQILGLAPEVASAVSSFETREELAQLRFQQEKARQTQQIVLFGLIILLTGFALYRLIAKRT